MVIIGFGEFAADRAYHIQRMYLIARSVHLLLVRMQSPVRSLVLFRRLAVLCPVLLRYDRLLKMLLDYWIEPKIAYADGNRQTVGNVDAVVLHHLPEELVIAFVAQQSHLHGVARSDWRSGE